MGRSKYKIYEPTHPHFLTCTILIYTPAVESLLLKKNIIKSGDSTAGV